MAPINQCTQQNPMPLDAPGRWQHEDAFEIEEDYARGGGVAEGDFIRYECPYCQHRFWIELPN